MMVILQKKFHRCSSYQTIQTHSDHNHCKSNKHRINHLAPSGFRISNAKHKITDPDNISDKQQAAHIKKHRQKEPSINHLHAILRKKDLFYFPHSPHLHKFCRCILSLPKFHSIIDKTAPVQDPSMINRVLDFRQLKCALLDS